MSSELFYEFKTLIYKKARWFCAWHRLFPHSHFETQDIKIYLKWYGRTICFNKKMFYQAATKPRKSQKLIWSLKAKQQRKKLSFSNEPKLR